ncbi:response regulator [Alsobacter sp. SYSU M60028]|uniref:Response regulator n=1 Tax=Alsobacter ponti TaxID=2962936 RepID=A0ABT1LGV1_9HYPH|nr:response regulator [Alsobacter ponti]MCP8940333.1 response regulator [Alsobacter ponti]
MTADIAAPILVVDDSPAMHRVIAEILSRCGVEDVEFANGVSDAVRKLSARAYSLVISDYWLGEQTGHDLHAAMASKRDWQDTPLILLTNQPDRADELFGQGGNRFWLTKPFTAQGLRGKIESALSGGPGA